MAASTELVPLTAVREAVISGKVPEVVDSDALAQQFALRLLEAENPEELFSVTEATDAKDILDTPLLLEDVQFLPSDYDEGGLGVYALLHFRDKHNKAFAVTCGGRNVVIQCLRATEEGWLPREVQLIEAGRQKDGRNRPLYLEMVKGGK